MNSLHFRQTQFRLVLIAFLFTSALWCASAEAVFTQGTMSEPTARFWREDVFDMDFVNSANLCTGAWHAWTYDPDWTNYSPTAAGTINCVTTTGIAPSVNHEMELLPGVDTLQIAYVDTTAQNPLGGSSIGGATDQGIYAKVTNEAEVSGESAYVFLRLSHTGGVPTGGYAMELDDTSSPGTLTLRLYELSAGPPPVFTQLGSVVTGLPADVTTGVYHVRFEVTGLDTVQLAGSAWPIGSAERDVTLGCTTPMITTTDTTPQLSGFAGVGVQHLEGGGYWFDDIVHYFIDKWSPITTTIMGFQGGGHYFSQAGNGNPDCPQKGAGHGPANMWCTPACLQMLMDYWDNRANNPSGGAGIQLPQEQIAHVCNVNMVAAAPAEFLVYTGVPGNWPGTQLDDSRRAIHFSSVNASLDGAVPSGYAGMRNMGPPYPWAPSGPYGWSARCSADGGGGWIPMSLAKGVPPSSAEKLRNLLSLGYPVIIHIPAGTGWFPWLSGKEEEIPTPTLPATEVGHSVLCIGYHLEDPTDPNNNWFEFHDPWHGPNVCVTEAFLFGIDSGGPEPLMFPSTWYSAGGPFTWGSPWEVTGLPIGNQTGSFGVNPTVTYPDPILTIMTPPEASIFPLTGVPGTQQAELSLTGGAVITAGTNPQNVANILSSGSSDNPSWTLNATPFSPTPYDLRCDAWGMMAGGASSSSYPAYQDELGGYNQETLTLWTAVRDWQTY